MRLFITNGMSLKTKRSYWYRWYYSYVVTFQYEFENVTSFYITIETVSVIFWSIFLNKHRLYSNLTLLFQSKIFALSNVSISLLLYNIHPFVIRLFAYLNMRKEKRKYFQYSIFTSSYDARGRCRLDTLLCVLLYIWKSMLFLILLIFSDLTFNVDQT